MCSVDQCCYSYGSVPRNDSNCVPGGSQFSLNCIVYNPRDIITNLTVRWFRSREALSAEAITDIQGGYTFLRRNTVGLTKNCTNETILYGDTFSLNIPTFTSDENGYYWCQIVVNGSSYQPLQYAWFYADNTNLCTRESHFGPADIIAQCANITYSTIFPPPAATTLTMTTFTTPNVTDLLTTVASKMTETGAKAIYYIIGILSVLVFLLVTLATLILLMLMYKRYKEHRQKNSESFVC